MGGLLFNTREDIFKAVDWVRYDAQVRGTWSAAEDLYVRFKDTHPGTTVTPSGFSTLYETIRHMEDKEWTQ